MNLLEIRTQFIKISGRYDLVVDAVDFVDNGANWYITQGQKSLERKINVKATKAKVYKDLAIGSYLISLKNCRAITGVWIITEDYKYPLEILHPERAKLDPEAYGVPLSTADRGLPLYWYPSNLRRSSDTEDEGNVITFGGETVTFGSEEVDWGYGSDSDTLKTYLDTSSPFDPTRTGLVLYPPTDAAYSIQVDGLFYNVELESDNDINYWTVEHSLLLIMSALRQLEMVSRGSKSASAWASLIDEELIGIDMDAAEEESASVTRTKG